MNIGSLYRVKQWYWFLFPSKESAADELSTHGGVTGPRAGATYNPDLASTIVAYYSFYRNKNVTYFSPDSHIVFLGEDGKIKKVLTSGGDIGWVWNDEEDWDDCFEEVNQP